VELERLRGHDGGLLFAHHLGVSLPIGSMSSAPPYPSAKLNQWAQPD
jgi:hypothetical protein